MNQKAKIAIAIGLLVVAGGVTFWFMRAPEEAAAKGEETRTFWMCAGCQVTADLTARQVEAGAKEVGPPGYPLACSKCKEKKLYRAVKCAKCGTPYFTSDVPDSTGMCPKCNPDAKPAVIEEQPEETKTEEGEKSESDTPQAPKRKKPPKAA